MQGFPLASKLVGESRLESLDVSASLGPTDILQSAQATISVYTGTDTNPSAVLGSLAVDTTYNLVYLNLNPTGVAGCTYQIVVTVTLVSGAQKVFTGFLAILPDAV